MTAESLLAISLPHAIAQPPWRQGEVTADRAGPRPASTRIELTDDKRQRLHRRHRRARAGHWPVRWTASHARPG